MRQALEFTLGTDNSAFNSGLRAAQSSVASFKNQVGGMVAGMFAGIGIQQLVSDFARVQDLADQFGTTAEAVQRVSGAAGQAGTNIETVARALAKIRADGGKALEKLGIDANAFKEAGMDEQILMISSALEKIPNEQDRINTAIDVLGPRVREILPLILQGYDSLSESLNKVAVLSGATVKQLAAADDAITAMTANVKVGGAWILNFFSNIVQTIGSVIGSQAAAIQNYVTSTLDVLGKLAKFDLEGAKKSASEIPSSMVDQMKTAANDVKLIWTGAGDANGKPKKKLFGEDGATGAAGANVRDINAEISKLEQDAAEKLLPIYDQLGKNAIDRLNIERMIAMTTDPDKKKELEDKLLANVKERLSLEDQQRKDDEQWQNTYAKQLEDEAKDREKEADKAAKQAEAAAKKKADIEEQQMRSLFDRRQNDIGFASGVSVQGATMGQQLAGVNYSVVNAEAQKQVQLQEQMRDYLAAIEAKKWSVEIPEAS